MTFAPEIASFHAPQPREPTPVPSWSIASPTHHSSLRHSQTNGALTSAITATPSSPTQSRTTRQDRSRFSLLRSKAHPPVSLKNGTPNGVVQQDNDSARSRSRSKENGSRRSFFGGGSRSENGDGGDGDWITDSGAGPESDGMRKSDSVPRSDVTGGVGSKVGSVRKRLSMLKLGKKSSKASVLVDSVVEE